MDNKERILGFNVCTLNKSQLLNKLKNDLSNGKKNIIYNINPLIVNNFLNNNEVKREFNKYEYNIPDGIGVVYASKLTKGKIKNRITGIELFLDICELATDNNYKIFLYGSQKGIAEKCKTKLEKKYNGIKIIGYENGYISEEEALESINNANPDILFVALGSPTQEEFIIKYQKELDKIKLIMPIGGTMDVISGSLKPAPVFYKKIHLEWLYRMIQEPKRFKHFFKLFKFVLLVIFRNNWYNEKAEEKI